jgi:hypothetical protein
MQLKFCICTVTADLPTPPGPTTTTRCSVILRVKGGLCSFLRVYFRLPECAVPLLNSKIPARINQTALLMNFLLVCVPSKLSIEFGSCKLCLVSRLSADSGANDDGVSLFLDHDVFRTVVVLS